MASRKVLLKFELTGQPRPRFWILPTKSNGRPLGLPHENGKLKMLLTKGQEYYLTYALFGQAGDAMSFTVVDDTQPDEKLLEVRKFTITSGTHEAQVRLLSP